MAANIFKVLDIENRLDDAEEELDDAQALAQTSHADGDAPEDPAMDASFMSNQYTRNYPQPIARQQDQNDIKTFTGSRCQYYMSTSNQGP